MILAALSVLNITLVRKPEIDGWPFSAAEELASRPDICFFGALLACLVFDSLNLAAECVRFLLGECVNARAVGADYEQITQNHGMHVRH